ncbi:MAG: ATP-dependent DNA helicase RecG [Deltaproteobacteria bacterium]|nr:ATP-dependent DNA helicase RecG [Deltaproteobacteria bacterium]
MPPSTHSNDRLASAVARLKRAISLALAGGSDPSDRSDLSDDLALLARAYEDRPEAPKVAAFTAAMCDPGSLPGVSRAVVLARGQRFLLALAMAIEDESGDETMKIRRRRDEHSAPSAGGTPFDPGLLALDGVGPKTAARLASRGLASPVDLLFWLPRRYDDRRTITPLQEVRAGMRVVIEGIVCGSRLYGRPWSRILEVEIEDGAARLFGVWFSNRRPKAERFVSGGRVRLSGLVSQYKDRLQIAHPVVVGEEDDGDRLGRVVPVYPEVPGVAGRVVEKAVRCAARDADRLVTDPLPSSIVARHGLLPLAQALRLVHLPPEDVTAAELDGWIAGSSPAHERLVFDEFFFVQLALALRRARACAGLAPALSASPALCADAGRLLGVTPTRAQERVVAEIAADLVQPRPMQRLLQGDVGSGKTLVALAAILAAVRSGCQAALMAPTEILAEQHMRVLHPVLEKERVRVALHIGEARSSTRRKTLHGLESGLVDLAIGTHALIEEGVRFRRLGLAVVDEQHRFGVSQRLGLVGKGPDGASPHLLVMTATPIPRTLALTVHGDLDICVLDELPPGRRPAKTSVWPVGERERALHAAEEAVARGEQVYLVCPVIEESGKIDARAAEQVFAEVAPRFGASRTGLLHGRLAPEAKEEVMDGFVAGRIQVLVTTTVIEVGVDVTNATVMIVDGAERFGLAQIHQLRGRVGRGSAASFCHLVADPRSAGAMERLDVLARTNDGFAVAEADLRLRGPGEIYGRRQAGLPGFRYGDLRRDAAVLDLARGEVLRVLAEDPTLAAYEHAGLKEELARRILAGDEPVAEEAG